MNQIQRTLLLIAAVSLGVSCQTDKSSRAAGNGPRTDTGTAVSTANANVAKAVTGEWADAKVEGVIHDANGNGIEDAIDIADGTSLDVDQNGWPDEVEIPK